MLYYTTYEGESLRIEIVNDPEGRTYVKLPDGRELAVNFEAVLGSDFFSLLVDNQSHEVYIEPGEERGDYGVTLDGQIYDVKVETERQHRLAALAPRTNVQTGEITLKAPMPGLVLIVAVEVGQAVEQGQRLVVLEAMKMENELRAPRAGTIKAIKIQAGQTVEQNRPLLIIE